MSGLKKDLPGFALSSNKVAAEDFDMPIFYEVHNPSISDTFYGTVSSATEAPFVLTNVKADYPRNVLFTVLGVAGGMGGTAVVNGLNQFGQTIQETISIGTANGGGTAAGTLIFREITSATVTPVGLGGTAIGTAKLGVAKGTAAGIVAKFGLPARIRAATDVQAITYINNGTATPINGGTVGTSTYVGTSNHTFNTGAVVAITDRYVVRIKSTFDSTEKPNIA